MTSERKALIDALDEEHNPSYFGGEPRDAVALVDAYRDEVALEMGRDCLKLGIVPFLIKLVGQANTDILFERQAGEPPPVTDCPAETGPFHFWTCDGPYTVTCDECGADGRITMTNERSRR